MREDLYIRAGGVFAKIKNKDETDRLLEELNISNGRDNEDNDNEYEVGAISFFISQIEMINRTNDNTAVLHFKSGKTALSTINFDILDDILRDWNAGGITTDNKTLNN